MKTPAARRACQHRSIAALAAISLLIGWSSAAAQPAPLDREELRLHRAQQTGAVSFIRGDGRRPLPVEPSAPGRQATADDFLRTYGQHFGLRDPATELTPPAEKTDALGFRHTTYRQVYKGVPVFSGVLRVHQNPAGDFTAANGRFYEIPATLKTTPSITADQAVRLATSALGLPQVPEVEQADLLIVDPGWYGDPPAGARLAYHLILTDLAAGVREAFFVDAASGKILDRWTLLESVRFRTVFDDSLGFTVRNEGGPATGDADSDAAYDYSGDTYDFLFRGFGRDSINDNGATLSSTVHLQSDSCPNAFGGTGGTFYCTGVVTDDIVAHEFVHGLTGFTANLIYQNQPGQLNESFSDVFGEAVDLLNGDAAFAGAPGGTPWPAHGTGPGTDTPNAMRTGCVSDTVMTVNSPGSIAGDYAAQPASFGPALTTTGVTADLVVADPIRACDVDGPFVNAGDMPGRIVLVRRGECFFTEKVKNAQDAGAVGVIVANNVSPGLSPMGGSDGTIVIPSVGSSQADGDLLVAEADSNTINVTLRANDDLDVRWLVGEDSSAFGGAIRDMWMPSCAGHPDTANHPFQTCNPNDNGGVHSGSGVPNHAFAILTDGKSFNGQNVAAIGLFKASAVWYRALTVYLTETSDFQDAYLALNQSAADLIGTTIKDPRDGSDFGTFTADDAAEVDKALLAVEMNTTGLCGSSNVLDPTPPTLCDGRIPLYSDDFESGANGWTVSHFGPSGPPTPYDWVQTGSLPAGRGGVAWFAADPSIGDCAGVDESAVHTLFSPEIGLPGSLDSPTVMFTHYSETEAFYDGGNVKISVDSGPWQEIPRSAFLHNPYNSGLATSGNTNPMAGQNAWTGISFDGAQWGTSVIDLDGFVSGGETVQFRFDLGKDGCAGVEGWYVDDFELFVCSGVPVPDPVEPDPSGIDRIRFISFVVPSSAGGETALRVEFDAIASPPGAPGGRQFRYVNAFSGPGGSLTCPDALPAFPDYPCARLGCEPEYRDWSSELGGTVLYVTGDSVAPSSAYLVTNIASSCGAAPGADACAAASVEVPASTAAWGDITGSGYGPPDGAANVLDIGAAVDKVKGLASAFPEARSWAKNQHPDPDAAPINVLDVGFTVDAVKGLAYPFAMDACP